VVGVVDSWVCGSVSDSAPICAARRWQVGIGSALGTRSFAMCLWSVCVFGLAALCASSVLPRLACAAVRPMADCSAAGSTEWLTERSYMPACAG
jgi:hypothetical protein